MAVCDAFVIRASSLFRHSSFIIRISFRFACCLLSFVAVIVGLARQLEA